MNKRGRQRETTSTSLDFDWRVLFVYYFFFCSCGLQPHTHLPKSSFHEHIYTKNFKFSRNRLKSFRLSSFVSEENKKVFCSSFVRYSTGLRRVKCTLECFAQHFLQLDSQEELTRCKRLYPSKTQIFLAEQLAASFVMKSLTTELILNCEKEGNEGKKKLIWQEKTIRQFASGGKDATPRETGRDLNVFYNSAIGRTQIPVKDWQKKIEVYCVRTLLLSSTRRKKFRKKSFHGC